MPLLAPPTPVPLPLVLVLVLTTPSAPAPAPVRSSAAPPVTGCVSSVVEASLAPVTSVVVLVDAVYAGGGERVCDGVEVEAGAEAEAEAEGGWCWMMVLLTAYL